MAWAWQTLLATYIVISKSCGFITVENVFPGGFENATFVSDSLSAYFDQIYHHQWATEMKDLLTRAIKLKDTMSPEQYAGSFDQRTAVMNEFDILINQRLLDTVPKIVPFQKRLKKRRHQVFNFMFYPDVPYDNNGSEMTIRNVKVKQKVSGSFRSERGAERYSWYCVPSLTRSSKKEEILSNQCGLPSMLPRAKMNF